MIRQIRQVALMVRDLEQAEERWRSLFGLEACARHRLDAYGLRNAILPMRETFLELLQPTREDSHGARFLERRGEGVYMVVLEAEGLDPLLERLKGSGAQVTGVDTAPHSRTAFLHPRSFFGTFLGLTEVQDRRRNPWPDAGPGWRRHARRATVRDLRQVAVAVNDLGAALSRSFSWFGWLPSHFREEERFGMRAAYLPVGVGSAFGRTFLEFLSPVREEGAVARFLRRWGEGPYLLMFQVEDLDRALGQVERGGGEVTQVGRVDDFRVAWIHPRSCNGVLVQLTEARGRNWPPAGDFRRVRPR